MALYVARHGQTQWNAENRICGRTDLPLNEVGLQQASALAEKAADCHLDVIVASPMLRARQTAELLFPDRPHIIMEGLRETDFD